MALCSKNQLISFIQESVITSKNHQYPTIVSEVYTNQLFRYLLYLVLGSSLQNYRAQFSPTFGHKKTLSKAAT